MSSLNQNCSEYELSDMVAEAGGGDKVTFDAFLVVMDKHLKDVTNHLDVREAFNVFDKDETGKVSLAQLKTLLTSMGNKLDEAEAETLFGFVEADGDGNVSY